MQCHYPPPSRNETEVMRGVGAQEETISKGDGVASQGLFFSGSGGRLESSNKFEQEGSN